MFALRWAPNREVQSIPASTCLADSERRAGGAQASTSGQHRQHTAAAPHRHRPQLHCRAKRGATVEEEEKWGGEEVELFNINDGWSLEVVADDFDVSDFVGEVEEDEQEGEPAEPAQVVEEELGMAAMEVMQSLPAHVLRDLEAAQVKARELNAETKANKRRRAAAQHKVHRQLRIIGGSAAGRRLLSPQGDQTRPMMEKVRGAVFSMVQAQVGMTRLPESSRWLDLFAGTGSVGIEALSRGAGQAHFIEMDPWVTSACLNPNLETCGVTAQATVYTMKAEQFLQRAKERPRFAGGAFDFISVCPPYLLVSYEELYDLLQDSPLLHENSIVLVEYPKRLAHLILEQLGPLVKVRDRRYGRTFVAIYGPCDRAQDSDEEDGFDDSEDEEE